MEITNLQLGEADIYITRIPITHETRRKRETAAVRALIDHAFGPDAQLAHDPDGVPYIAGCNANISISHSWKYALLAIGSTSPIGADIEEWREQLERVTEKYISKIEMDHFTASQQMRLKAWTLKEAVYKAAHSPGLALAEGITLSEGADGRTLATDAYGRKYICHTTTLADGEMISLAEIQAEA